jgi:hypothetical protein
VVLPEYDSPLKEREDWKNFKDYFGNFLKIIPGFFFKKFLDC